MGDANQNNVELSTATTAEEEAQRHGSKGKQSKLEQGGSLDSSTDGYLAAKKAYKGFRVSRVSIQILKLRSGSKLEQGGSLDSSTDGYLAEEKAYEGFRVSIQILKLRSDLLARNFISMTNVLMGYEPVPIKEDENEPMLQPPVSPSIPRVRPSSESAGDTGGTMEMESGTNTHSNPSQENAETSCKSKTAEWALLVTSVVLEATSAIFDQLGYALTSMVMAYVALLLSILDLILKARERGITCDGRGLLPCFYRHDVRNRKPFASLVQYFGLAGALWQCCFTTVGYHYTHHNPIKLCLLPFILALCVLISKVVKSSQHVPLDKST